MRCSIARRQCNQPSTNVLMEIRPTCLGHIVVSSTSGARLSGRRQHVCSVPETGPKRADIVDLDPVSEGGHRTVCPVRSTVLWNVLIATFGTIVHTILVAPRELVRQRHRREQLVRTRVVFAPHNAHGLLNFVAQQFARVKSGSTLRSTSADRENKRRFRFHIFEESVRRTQSRPS